MPWALVALGYFAGSVPFGLLITALIAQKDVRSEGSGNIGATNVARVLGKRWGAVVLVLDATKGALPVLLGVRLWPEQPLWHVAIAGAAFLGHVFPVWLKFKGGKGVATALGVLAVLLPQAALAGFVAWLVVIATARISSVGSLAGALATLAASFWLGGPLPYSLLGVALFAAMLWTHRANLSRLRARREPRV